MNISPQFQEVEPTDVLYHIHHTNDSDPRVYCNSLQKCCLEFSQLVLVIRDRSVDVRNRVLCRPNP